jgi:hypothetical protein
MKILCKNLAVLILFLAMSMSSCEWMSYKSFEPDPYDGAFTWTKLIDDADWGNRYDHASTVFNDRLWIFGGYNPGKTTGDTYYEDVWSSTDGSSWDLATAQAPWHGRRGHEVIVFKDALYLIGGFEVDESTGYRQYTNDVWTSNDGTEWTLLKPRTDPVRDSLADWMPRMEHSCTVKVVDGIAYIYLIAGRTMQENIDGRFATIYHNDVWRSTDAITWEKLENNDFGIRGDQAFAINPSTGRMYIQGGTHGFTFTPEPGSTHPIEQWEYLWYSDDGEDWTAVNDTASFDQGLLWRSSHQMIFYQNSLWGLPGKTMSNEHYLFAKPQYYPIWRYHTNGEWEVDSYGAAFDPRHGYTSEVFDNKVWILGGFTSNNGQVNEVWYGEIK